MHADIMVIGGGMIGLSSALYLARAGKKIILIEKEFSGKHASGVNAGGVRSLKRDLNELPLIHGALEMWQRMSEIVGSDCGFFSTGYLIAAENNEDMVGLEKRAAETQALGYQNEILIDRQQVTKLAPPIASHCVGGIMSKHDGHASPAESCRAFLAACIQEGVVAHMGCEALEIKSESNGFAVKTSTRGTLKAEQVLNASGAWAAKIGNLVDDPLPVTPVGPSVMVTARLPRYFHRFVTANSRKLWFNQATNRTIFIMGGYLADVDLEKGKTHLRFEELQKCIRTAQELVPMVKTLPIVRAWAGLDGNTPDNVPIIDYSTKVPGLLHACGFSKHGFGISPMVGKVISSIMQGKRPEISVKGLSLGRFGNKN